MNYHIITQDKFFNSYIQDIYDLGLQDKNIFAARGNEGENTYLSPYYPIHYLTYDEDKIISWLKQIHPSDKLFVSWYDTWMGGLIIKSSIKCQVYVYVMGGEFYEDPLAYNADWLYDVNTYQLLKKYGVIPSIRLRRTSICFKKLFSDPWRLKMWRYQKNEGYHQKLEVIKRIDYIAVSPEEYRFIQHLYPTLNAQLFPGGFNQNFDDAIKLPTKKSPEKSLNILVGNSSKPSNNLADCFYFISDILPAGTQIYSITSYGSEVGKKIALKIGNKVFGENFNPVDTFMERLDYLDFLNKMDCLIMYHNRQEAYGNVFSAVALGKPVFLKATNIMYEQLSNIGIKSIYDVRDLASVSILDCIKEAQSNREHNCEVLSQRYSRKTRLNNLQSFL